MEIGVNEFEEMNIDDYGMIWVLWHIGMVNEYKCDCKIRICVFVMCVEKEFSKYKSDMRGSVKCCA